VEGAELIAAWRANIKGLGKSWVLFENGTCVIFKEPGPDWLTGCISLSIFTA
jgi:hypothetical protein